MTFFDGSFGVPLLPPMTFFLEAKYPVQTMWQKYVLPFTDNASVVWAGQIAMIVDAEGSVFQADELVFDTPWYYCAPCIDDERRTRLSIGAKFCPECGAKLDFENLERDPEAERDVLAVVRAKVDGMRNELPAE